MAAGQEITPFCPLFRQAIELIGRRWTGAIIRALLAGAIRFTDIAEAIPGISDRLLSERLKELETEGVVERLVMASTPVRVEYRLTQKGHELVEVVTVISTWAERWLPGDGCASADATVPAGVAPLRLLSR